ncbi:hypothetical protein ETD86_00320 [Nonomuraea turkmeniaca]|uniref:HTH luxR-type domain-containing protein n=1 Tax=Nonomuraea turkmeniaca TaxID=103838 RepID=A0A5S4FZR7_9ACTN|nr:DUF6879 family protein [Nonomuraea turkmeniaca]TMR25611.1 hypothetical protein ETD86_00320 [Nonomuraea turkmeniaca]
MLEALGVDPSAEQVYLEILKRPYLGVAGLAARLGWTVEAVRAALAELTRLSLLRPSLEPDLFRPVRPDVGLEVLLARQRVEIMQRQQLIEEGRAAMDVLVADYAGRHDATVAKEIRGRVQVREKLEQLGYSAERELLSFAPGGEAFPPSRPLAKWMLGQGLTIRTVYLTSSRNDAVTSEHVRWLAEHGGSVRTVPVLPTWMLAIDRRCVVVPLDPEQPADGVAVHEGRGVVAAMCALFDQIWHTAEPTGVRSTDNGDLSAQERSLLRLMLRVDTDEQAARSMGVSTRTIGRMAAELMCRLGAKNRFQAGAIAVERGWI